MTSKITLEILRKNLEDNNYHGIIAYITDNNSIRDAVLYLDVYVNDKLLYKRFKAYAYCSCGGLALSFSPEPTCAACIIPNAIKKLDFN